MKNKQTFLQTEKAKSSHFDRTRGDKKQTKINNDKYELFWVSIWSNIKYAKVQSWKAWNMFSTKNFLCQLWWATTIPCFKCAKITSDKYEWFWVSVMSRVNYVKSQLWKYQLCYDSDSQAQLCQFQLCKYHYQLCAHLMGTQSRKDLAHVESWTNQRFSIPWCGAMLWVIMAIEPV